MPDTKKPLPALPSPNLASTLSIKARVHYSHLIRHFLAESESQDATSSIHTRLDSWVYAIEEALDDFSTSVGKGEWLAGVRRWREARYRASSERESNNKPTLRAMSPGPTQETPEDSTQKKLHQLREHILHNTALMADKALFHLLLCLTPCGLHVQDSAADIGPTSIGCSFATSKFLLPLESSLEH
ncbi:hypothetical protein NP233_g12229 [Leucocoprinus birnbaumii]|uniref:Uncharacterized protein n=1 Tax=Leucocoprinus birnbaumii TaxID=56174 RepID=A0AAD5VGN8_9AGAR|nr:hypothetical protein NP233_g12229 [Leucocoprinus birnbaumii]